VPVLTFAVWVGTEANMYCRFVKGAATRKLQDHALVGVVGHEPGPEGNPPPVPYIEYVVPVIRHLEPPHEQAQLALAPVKQFPHCAYPPKVAHEDRPVKPFVEYPSGHAACVDAPAVGVSQKL